MTDHTRTIERAPDGKLGLGEGFPDLLARLRREPGGLAALGGFAAAFALLAAGRNTHAFRDTLNNFAAAASHVLSENELGDMEDGAILVRPLFTDALNARLQGETGGDE